MAGPMCGQLPSGSVVCVDSLFIVSASKEAFAQDINYTGVRNLITPTQTLDVYPGPASDLLTVKLASKATQCLPVINIAGEQVLEKQVGGTSCFKSNGCFNFVTFTIVYATYCI